MGLELPQCLCDALKDFKQKALEAQLISWNTNFLERRAVFPSPWEAPRACSPASTHRCSAPWMWTCSLACSRSGSSQLCSHTLRSAGKLARSGTHQCLPRQKRKLSFIVSWQSKAYFFSMQVLISSFQCKHHHKALGKNILINFLYVRCCKRRTLSSQKLNCFSLRSSTQKKLLVKALNALPAAPIVASSHYTWQRMTATHMLPSVSSLNWLIQY